jgi:hypothetical protein
VRRSKELHEHIQAVVRLNQALVELSCRSWSKYPKASRLFLSLGVYTGIPFVERQRLHSSAAQISADDGRSREHAGDSRKDLGETRTKTTSHPRQWGLLELDP